MENRLNNFEKSFRCHVCDGAYFSSYQLDQNKIYGDYERTCKSCGAKSLNNDDFIIPIKLSEVDNIAHKEDILENIVEILNEAFKADPVAIHSLICNRVPCNKALADHPNISVDANPVLEETQYTVSMLGILVGLSERITGKRIAIKFIGHERPKLLGFCEYKSLKEGE